MLFWQSTGTELVCTVGLLLGATGAASTEMKIGPVPKQFCWSSAGYRHWASLAF